MALMPTGQRHQHQSSRMPKSSRGEPVPPTGDLPNAPLDRSPMPTTFLAPHVTRAAARGRVSGSSTCLRNTPILSDEDRTRFTVFAGRASPSDAYLTSITASVGDPTHDAVTVARKLLTDLCLWIGRFVDHAGMLVCVLDTRVSLVPAPMR